MAAEGSGTLMRTLISIGLLLGLAGAADAQELERPWLDPDAVDIDEEREGTSLFWERAIYPHKQLYDSRVKRAETYLAKRDEQSLKEAEALLRSAIGLAPDDPRAHWYLGAVEFENGNWKNCAVLRATVARLDPDFEATGLPNNVGGAANLDLGLGQCLALSGDYEGALRRYKHMLSKGDFVAASSYQLRWRMGEAYMALGRLDEAIASLKEAMRLNGREYIVFYALAAAYDRNEQIAATRDMLLQIALRDRSRSTMSRSGLHVTPPEDVEYYHALSKTLVPALSHPRASRRGANNPDLRPEALARFRLFLSLHGNGPWARRARHHVAVLSGEPLSASNVVQFGGAQFDEAKAVAAVERANDALQTCVRVTPGAVFAITITALAKQPRNVRKPVPRLPGGGGGSASIPGVRSKGVAFIDTPAEAMAAAERCLDVEASQLSLPVPTGPAGDSVTLEFPVVSQHRQ